MPYLRDEFEKLVFIGSTEDLSIPKNMHDLQIMPFDDRGDLSKTAKLMSESRLVIGHGSSMVALAGILGVPSIRIHDTIGDFPMEVFSNLGPKHVNFGERWDPQEFSQEFTQSFVKENCWKL